MAKSEAPLKALRSRWHAWRYKAGASASVSFPGITDLTFSLHSKTDSWCSKPIAEGETYDPHITDFIIRALSSNDLFIDIGANIGLFSVLGSRIVGINGKVMAFEPDPFNYKLLRMNLRHNRCHNVSCYQKAVGSTAKSQLLARSEENQGDHQLSLVGDRSDNIPVQVVPLDAFARYMDRPISLIKMDTQGSEAAILGGMKQLIADKRIKRVILEFWPYGLERCGSSAADLLELCETMEMTMWFYHSSGNAEKLDRERILIASENEYRPSTMRFTDLVLVHPDDAHMQEWLYERTP